MAGYPPPARYGASSESMLVGNSNNGYGDSSANLNNEKAGYAGGAGKNELAGYPAARGASSSSSNKRKWFIVGGVVAGIIILAAVLGGIFGARAANKTNSSTSGGIASNDNAGAKASPATTLTSVLPDGQTTTVTPSATAAATPKVSVSALPQWSWKDSSYVGALQAASSGSSGNTTAMPMVGLALGNWLVLEQWMYESWFNASASNNASVVDEWTLMQQLGDDAKDVMTKHWSTWVTEADIESAHQAGINHLRIPVGFWAFIDAANNEPYLFKAGQLDFLEQVLGWAYARKMYAIIDLHGLPGSQNGEVTSGHKTSNPTFFTDAQQTRADALVDAALAWITASPYRSIISALELANEPRPYTTAQFTMLQAYYQRAYDKASSLANPIPVQFHHGFPNQAPQVNMTVEAMWMPFVQGKDPNLIQLVQHPYIGTFPLQNNAEDMLNQVCTNAAKFAQWPIPVVVTEWSLRTGISTTAYEQTMYSQQAQMWAQSGGGVFWSSKAYNGSAANNQGNSIQWSFLDLIAKGSIPMPASGASTMDYLKSMDNSCGSPATMSWAS